MSKLLLSSFYGFLLMILGTEKKESDWQKEAKLIASSEVKETGQLQLGEKISNHSNFIQRQFPYFD